MTVNPVDSPNGGTASAGNDNVSGSATSLNLQNLSGGVNSFMKNEHENTVADDLHNVAYQTGERIRQAVVSRKNKIDDIAENCTQHIREKPLESALLAFSAGYLLASLLRRR